MKMKPRTTRRRTTTAASTTVDELRQQCPASETAEIVGLPGDIEIFYERGMVVVGFEVKVKEQPPVPGVH